MRFDLPWYFLSFSGRISRQEFRLGYVGLVVFVYALRNPLEAVFLNALKPPSRDWHWDELATALAIPKLALAAIFAWPLTAIFAKRMHDFNCSAWWILTLAAVETTVQVAGFDRWGIGPVLGLLLLALVRGTRGDNRFGADPLARATAA
jgi:uncharacterized membrane protein YhaH (DUF805 family)